MTKHTPGPWKVTGTWKTTVRTFDGLFIAECGPEPMNGAQADARLIAEAPNLLEAAKAAVARQVINNWATAGEWVCRNCGEMPSEHAHDEGCWVALCNAAIAAAEGVE